jgi:hypothetical protein
MRDQILLCQLPTNTPDTVSLFATAMHKPSFPHQAPIRRTCEETVAHFDAMLAGLEMRAGADKERGLVIFDQSAQAKTLHSLVTEFRPPMFSADDRCAGGPFFNCCKIASLIDPRFKRELR